MLQEIVSARNGLEGNKSRVALESVKLSQATSNASADLDSVVNIIMASCPEDISTCDMFFPGEKITRRKYRSLGFSSSFPEITPLGISASGLATGLFIVGFMSTGYLVPLGVISAFMILFGYGIYLLHAWTEFNKTTQGNKSGVLVRFERAGVEWNTYAYAGHYQYAPLAPSNDIARNMDAARGWAKMPFSQIIAAREIPEAHILSTFEQATKKWFDDTQKKVGLAEDLLRQHAERVGIS